MFIQSQSKMEISDSFYGYTSIIYSRPSNIYAISKALLPATRQKKSFFQDAPAKWMRLRSKIEQARISKLQGTAAREQQGSLHLSASFLIKRHLADKSDRNQRSIFCRNVRSRSRGIKIIHSEDFVRNSYEYYFQKFKIYLKSMTQNKTFQSLNKSDALVRFVIQRDNREKSHHYFQSNKEQTNYFTSSNRDQVDLLKVLYNYETRFFFTTNDEAFRKQFITRRMYNEVGRYSIPTQLT